ncbi:hypothetical protein AK812_SmicGene9596 [Symbiodinium microadriaticum]|uniref:Flavin reductase like domain-containing protein n=1 Tax=Symbiodinium microadriaticum TaxID=2951 RepID=A0A1Q9EHX4_SYMMI|nr:hypothetical protein AK812_SmicGene9596 [Symbiodinium microadriaticum]
MGAARDLLRRLAEVVSDLLRLEVCETYGQWQSGLVRSVHHDMQIIELFDTTAKSTMEDPSSSTLMLQPSYQRAAGWPEHFEREHRAWMWMPDLRLDELRILGVLGFELRAMAKNKRKPKQIVPKSKDDKPGSPPATFAFEAPKPTLNKRGPKRKGKTSATEVTKPPQEAASGRSESIDDIFSKAKSKAASAAQPEGGSKRRTQTGDGKRQKEVKKPKRGSLEDPFGRSSDWTDDGLGGIYNQEGWTGRRTKDELRIFKAHLIKVGEGGGTPLCPFVLALGVPLRLPDLFADCMEGLLISSGLELSTRASGAAISATASDGKCGQSTDLETVLAWRRASDSESCAQDIAVCEQVLKAALADEALLMKDGFRATRVLMSQLVDKLRQGGKPERKPKSGRTSLPSGVSEDDKERASYSVCEVKPAQFSRLVYTNPVCLLSSCQGSERNLMTVSWLTAVDNNGHLVLSLNKRRHSAGSIMSSRAFVLNVPTAQLAQTVLEIGGCSGGTTDKIERFSAPLGGFCLPGWKPLGAWPPSDEDSEAGKLVFAISGCVAHLVVHVLVDLDEISSHHLLVCKVIRAFVRSTYWDGKIFSPRLDMDTLTPPYMSFFGSQTFGYVVPGCCGQGGE